ncbi:hypothetical protein HPB52_006517 [Rhipicephalus sanguineus]|uniref:DDE Tnp4 domain-containing protein n=1 Tax=Rhipicephalus sanguineus TaxID=34632 RepID=A0A9D4Q9B2_RHISA|nr:hypothetical protein HPB52_006517 [Rhipicephalus sanguineus]
MASEMAGTRRRVRQAAVLTPLAAHRAALLLPRRLSCGQPPRGNPLGRQRFRRLYLVDAARMKQCCSIIMCACVLHNICNEERDFCEELRKFPDLEEVGNDEDSGVVVDRSVEGYSECLRKAIAQKQC